MVLQLANILLACISIAIIGYAGYMYRSNKTHDTHTEGLPLRWFIFAFGGAGVFTLLTAATGLVGAATNSRIWLGLYAFLAVLLLLAQAALALALFADSSWQKRMPHDETGEAAKLEQWVRHRMAVCRWVGLGVLLLQVASVLLAFMLSAAQQRVLEEDSEEDREVWGRRYPLLQPGDMAATSSSGRTLLVPHNDPWSQRMRDKYGLDA